MMKLLTIVGARPQFIKAAAVSRATRGAFAGQVDEVLVHTGQHHDDNMSQVFFDELEIPPPAFNLGIAGGGHGEMTGRMLEALERILRDERPDWVLIYGDTNSTLAGALAAAKLCLPLAHVEAGLRSFNMRMPEEVNRIVADRVSTRLFCPTDAAMQNLAREGLVAQAQNVGDVMFDVALHHRERARATSGLLARHGLDGRDFVLATCHRAENTDDARRLTAVADALAALAERLPVLLPLHPRARRAFEAASLAARLGQVQVVDPLPFLDMIAAEQAARVIVTDSGGVQKEAFFYGVPCVTMRDETEWTETVALGWNTLTGADAPAIVGAVERALDSRPVAVTASPYGDGQSAEKILRALVERC
jgi:UDP-GlcNAc3NAcA epimerase